MTGASLVEVRGDLGKPDREPRPVVRPKLIPVLDNADSAPGFVRRELVERQVLALLGAKDDWATSDGQRRECFGERGHPFQSDADRKGGTCPAVLRAYLDNVAVDPSNDSSIVQHHPRPFDGSQRPDLESQNPDLEPTNDNQKKREARNEGWEQCAALRVSLLLASIGCTLYGGNQLTKRLTFGHAERGWWVRTLGGYVVAALCWWGAFKGLLW